LGRELSVAEIAAVIKAVPDIETEVFIHGALCRSVSGKCYLSKALGGRSADRGECASPCRLPFRDERGRKYCLSLKDNCALPVLSQLIEIGVTSFKVEGRQKRAEYACAAGLVYRKAIDGEDYSEQLELLKRITPGVKWTCGYLDGTHADMINYSEHYAKSTADTERAAKEIMSLCRQTRDTAAVQAAFACKRGAPTVLTFVDDDGNSFTTEGEVPQEADGAGLDTDRAAAYIGKLGGEPYYISEFCADIDGGLFVSAAVLNGLRRDCACGLSELRAVVGDFSLGNVDVSGVAAHKTPKYLMMMRNIAGTPQVVTDERGRTSREFKLQGDGEYVYLI
jgi:Collagenase and related proteases